MSKYHVWINCSGFMRLVVEANSKAEAESEAARHYQCNEASAGDVDEGETRIATEEDLQIAEDYS